MKFASVASLLFLANWAAASYCPWTEADLNGTWWNSCSDCSFDQDSCVLSCNCDSDSGQSYPSSIDLRNCSAKKVHNDDGSLTCESSFCIWNNRRYYEDLAGTQRSEEINEAFCAQRCRNTTDCLFYTFWNDGGCHIHGADATMSDHWEDGEPIAGNAYCEGYSCMQFNKAGNGGFEPGAEGKHTTTAMSCRNFCRDTEGCLAYTWYDTTWCRIHVHGDLEYDVIEKPGAVYSKVSCATAVPTRSPTRSPTAAPTVPAAYIGENHPENDKGLACGGTSINMDHHWENIESRMHVDFPVENQINFQVHGGPNSQGMNIALVDKDNLDDANSAGLELFIGASSEPVIHLSTCIGCTPFIYENIAETPLIVEGKSTRGWVKINGNTVSVGTGGVAQDNDESDDVETEIFSTTVDNIPFINRAVFAHGFDDVDCHVIPS